MVADADFLRGVDPGIRKEGAGEGVFMTVRSQQSRSKREICPSCGDQTTTYPLVMKTHVSLKVSPEPHQCKLPTCSASLSW